MRGTVLRVPEPDRDLRRAWHPGAVGGGCRLIYALLTLLAIVTTVVVRFTITQALAIPDPRKTTFGPSQWRGF